MGDVSSLIIQSFIQHCLSLMEFHKQAFPSATSVVENKPYVSIRVSTNTKWTRKKEIHFNTAK